MCRNTVLYRIMSIHINSHQGKEWIYEPLMSGKALCIEWRIRDKCINRRKQHVLKSRKHFEEVQPELVYLLSFHWLPKLHKNLYGARFIAAANKCTTKPLSKLHISFFRVISCRFQQLLTGVNCYWIIDNSQQVLSALNMINYFSATKLLGSYDISTLYTCIYLLKYAFATLIREAYGVRDNVFLVHCSWQ